MLIRVDNISFIWSGDAEAIRGVWGCKETR